MKKLFWLLMPYLNKEYYYGGRGMIIIIHNFGRSRGWRHINCFCCGNCSNGVAVVKIGIASFALPICNKHIASWMDKHTNGSWSLKNPGRVIDIHPKYIDNGKESIQLPGIKR